jgi:membrane protein DedA with SNARE-associated domain
VHSLIAADLAGTWWQYLLLFLAVTASWAGVPFIGATATGAAGLAASQGALDLAAVIVVATVAGEVGGLLGYAIGVRWGRRLMERPGRHQAGRQKVMARGEEAYAKWGRLAVFFTPAIVSGTAKMRHGQFALWNFVASLAFALSVTASAYGLGRIVTGHHSARDVAILLGGVAVGVLLVAVFVRRHRRFKAAQAPAP